MTPELPILIVDDEPLILSMLEMALTADGYKVVTARSGDEAIRCACLQRFDLFMIDLIMPRKDGIETILTLRASDKKTPIIAMSGGWNDGANNCLPLAEKIGACGILAKPFDRNTLLATVRREIRRPELMAMPPIATT